ncbi:MAG TPA: nucleotidyltransferase [Spirochaetota bacterium]|nr:nucleotidyltransferase [Spirochaetota bacterium]
MDKTYFSPDTFDLLRLLGKYKVKYLIIGGEAVIFYGYSRLTGDVDIYYDNSSSNSENLFNALYEFWDGDIPGIDSAEEFQTPGIIIQFGQPPNRIDLINTADGITFDEAWELKVRQEINNGNSSIEIFYIGLETLIKNKTASGRYKDLDDLRFLTRIKRK